MDLQQERRRFFRIEDAVSLSYQTVPDDSLPERLERLQRGMSSDFTVMGSLTAIGQEVAGVLRKIEGRHPEVADYLKALDRKLDLLGRAFLAQNTDLVDQPATPVNLSASGMAFFTPERLDVGSILELKLLLMPSHTGILIYADVVSCEAGSSATDESGYQIRVDFSHLRECDQDVLIRHILQRQGETLRQRREAEEE